MQHLSLVLLASATRPSGPLGDIVADQPSSPLDDELAALATTPADEGQRAASPAERLRRRSAAAHPSGPPGRASRARRTHERFCIQALCFGDFHLGPANESYPVAGPGPGRLAVGKGQTPRGPIQAHRPLQLSAKSSELVQPAAANQEIASRTSCPMPSPSDSSDSYLRSSCSLCSRSTRITRP